MSFTAKEITESEERRRITVSIAIIILVLFIALPSLCKIQVLIENIVFNDIKQGGEHGKERRDKK